jgi:hypothetical protein
MLMLFLFLVSLPYGLAEGGSETGLSPAAD